MSQNLRKTTLIPVWTGTLYVSHRFIPSIIFLTLPSSGSCQSQRRNPVTLVFWATFDIVDERGLPFEVLRWNENLPLFAIYVSNLREHSQKNPKTYISLPSDVVSVFVILILQNLATGLLYPFWVIGSSVANGFQSLSNQWLLAYEKLTLKSSEELPE